MLDITSNLNTAKITSFLGKTREMSRQGIPVDRKRIRSFSNTEKLKELAHSYLGNDSQLLVDTKSVISFVNEMLSLDVGLKESLALRRRTVSVFRNPLHEDVLLSEQAILFYHILKETKYEKFARGVALQVLSITLESEFTGLDKVSTNSKLVPNFGESTTKFEWRRCPQYFNSYMLDLCLPSGYSGYSFSTPNLTQRAFLVDDSTAMNKVNSVINSSPNGLLIKELSQDVEAKLFPYILKGNVVNELITGTQKSRYDELLARFEMVDINTVYSIYNFLVKPRLIEVMGATLDDLASALESNGVTSNDMYIYYLSLDTVGVAVKDGVDINSLLPDLAHLFTPVVPFSFDEEYLLSGQWL